MSRVAGVKCNLRNPAVATKERSGHLAGPTGEGTGERTDNTHCARTYNTHFCTGAHCSQRSELFTCYVRLSVTDQEPCVSMQ